MALTLAEVLTIPVVQLASPEVLSGPDPTSCRVRWVHTSEIYDIGPLLRGQELLLTTGLGLIGASPNQLRRYVDSLADRGVTGLCLELGRTFEQIPPALLEQARLRDISLVAFHGVVPFVDITEAVHERLLSGEMRRMRLAERVSDDLARCILDGGGIDALLLLISDHFGGPVRLESRDGNFVAGVPTLPDDQVQRASDVVVHGRVWGALRGAGGDGLEAQLVLDKSATTVGVFLLRSDATITSRSLARRTYLRDLTLGRQRPEESAAAAARIGLATGPGRVLVACALDIANANAGSTVVAVETAARRTLGTVLVTDLEEAVLLVASLPRTAAYDLRALGLMLASAVDEDLRSGRFGGLRGLVMSELTEDLTELPQRLGNARESLALVRQSVTGSRVMLTRDLAIHRLLVSALHTPAMSRFIEGQLSPLIAHDSRHRRALLPTLEAFVTNGANKAATAAAMRIKRQTLYNRIAKIEGLLGVDLTDSTRRTSIHVALIAWHLRFGAAGMTAPTTPACGYSQSTAAEVAPPDSSA